MRTLTAIEVEQLTIPAFVEISDVDASACEGLVERGLMRRDTYEDERYFYVEYRPTELGKLALRAWRALEELKPA